MAVDDVSIGSNCQTANGFLEVGNYVVARQMLMCAGFWIQFLTAN